MTNHDGPTETRTPDGWWHRHWKWVVPVLVLVPLLTCAGTAFFVAGQVFGLMKNTEPYQLSIAEIHAHPEVKAALGQPIEEGFFVTGQIKMGTPSTANIAYRISGPQGSGSVHVVADTSVGAWMITTHTVDLDDSTRTIDLRADPSE